MVVYLGKEAERQADKNNMYVEFRSSVCLVREDAEAAGGKGEGTMFRYERTVGRCN